MANTIAAFCAARDTVLAVVAALEQTREAVPSNISEATASFGSERRDESPGGLGHAGGAAGASAGLIEPAGGSRRSPALEDSDFEDDSGPREGGGNARGGSGGGSGDGTQASYIPATVYSLLKAGFLEPSTHLSPSARTHVSFRLLSIRFVHLRRRD